jgi:hypothetical protein
MLALWSCGRRRSVVQAQRQIHRAFAGGYAGTYALRHTRHADPPLALPRKIGATTLFISVSSLSLGVAQLSCLWLALASLALFEPIAVAVHFEDVDVVGQSVEQRTGQPLGPRYFLARFLGPLTFSTVSFGWWIERVFLAELADPPPRDLFGAPPGFVLGFFRPTPELSHVLSIPLVDVALERRRLGGRRTDICRSLIIVRDGRRWRTHARPGLVCRRRGCGGRRPARLLKRAAAPQLRQIGAAQLHLRINGAVSCGAVMHRPRMRSQEQRRMKFQANPFGSGDFDRGTVRQSGLVAAPAASTKSPRFRQPPQDRQRHMGRQPPVELFEALEDGIDRQPGADLGWWQGVYRALRGHPRAACCMNVCDRV